MKHIYIHMPQRLLANNFRIGKRISYTLYLITIILMVFLFFQNNVEGQLAVPIDGIKVAGEVVEKLQGKDINYVIGLSGILSIGFSFWLVREMLKSKDGQIQEIKEQGKLLAELQQRQIDAIHNLADEIRQRRK